MGIICFIVLAHLAVLSSCKTRAADANQYSLAGQWFTYILSRGFYFLLICMIFVCCIITAIKSKFEKISAPKETSVDDRTHTKYLTDAQVDDSSNDTMISVKGKLMNAEEMILSLQSELQETRRTVTCLESSLDVGRSRVSSEEDLFNSRLEVDLEVETLKKEKELLQKQLQRASKTIESLNRQIEVLQREAKITEAALQDNENLSDRLRGARSEVDGLKLQLQGIKVERDTAVRFAAEHIHKMTAKTSPQKIEVIEDMIDEELKRLREEEEAKEEVRYRMKGIHASAESHGQGEPSSTASQPTGIEPTNTMGDGPITYTLNEDDVETETSTYSDNTLTKSDDSRKSRIVTRSPAFKAFLHDIFGQTS